MINIVKLVYGVNFSKELHIQGRHQVAAGSNQKSLLFTGHIDGVDNIFGEQF